MRSKRGQEMTVGTLVMIVLAIIVLVVLALGFGMGWTNLWSKITGYFTPVNVDSIKQACTYACTTQATYDFCCRIRDVKMSADADPVKMTCTDSRIKPTDCTLSCSDSDCQALICGYEGSGTNVVSGTEEEPAECEAGKDAPERVLKVGRNVLGKYEACCKV